MVINKHAQISAMKTIYFKESLLTYSTDHTIITELF